MKKVKLIVLLFVSFMCFEETLSNFFISWPKFTHENGNSSPPVLNFIGLVERHGYPAEEHQVTTKDGYKLRVHRIPGSPKQPSSDVTDKPVVYIQHGILGSSDLFVLAGPEKDLPYILADAGYDVWIGNARGNTYSRSHVTLSPDHDSSFWKFSFHEIAVYDISATIDNILYKTGQKSLTYIGHSMGTTMSFVLLSMRPEYNQKIHLVINLATVGNWKQPRNFMKFLKDNGNYIKAILRPFGTEELLGQSPRSAHFFKSLCRDGSALQPLCMRMLSYVCGFDPDVMDFKLFVDTFAYNPAGSSAQTFFHFHQNMIAGKLQMYDYGLIGNLMRYSRVGPPAYNLENVVTQVVMIYGKGDPIATPEDSLELSGILRNAQVESVPHDNFGHLDFMWATNIKGLLQDRILEILQEFPGPA